MPLLDQERAHGLLFGNALAGFTFCCMPMFGLGVDRYGWYVYPMLGSITVDWRIFYRRREGPSIIL